MHYTLVLSPEGPTLLRMIESVHRLLPYVVVRQTLKIGNVASMISAMMKVLLAKASVGAVTNWIGWSSGADEGMNLLQQYVSPPNPPSLKLLRINVKRSGSSRKSYPGTNATSATAPRSSRRKARMRHPKPCAKRSKTGFKRAADPSMKSAGA